MRLWRSRREDAGAAAAPERRSAQKVRATLRGPGGAELDGSRPPSRCPCPGRCPPAAHSPERSAAPPSRAGSCGQGAAQLGAACVYICVHGHVCDTAPHDVEEKGGAAARPATWRAGGGSRSGSGVPGSGRPSPAAGLGRSPHPPPPAPARLLPPQWKRRSALRFCKRCGREGARSGRGDGRQDGAGHSPRAAGAEAAEAPPGTGPCVTAPPGGGPGSSPLPSGRRRPLLGCPGEARTCGELCCSGSGAGGGCAGLN